MPPAMVVPHPASTNRTAIADFAEIESLSRADNQVSLIDITRILYRESDRLSEETVRQQAGLAFDEIADRADHCGKMERIILSN